MEYIKPKDFLKQSKEIQKVFLDWWKPSIGDIYCNIYNNQINNILVINSVQLQSSTFADDIKQFGFLLFTESQLRRFIEDKTGGKIEIRIWDDYGYSIRTKKGSLDGGKNLLETLWNVCCLIAQDVNYLDN